MQKQKILFVLILLAIIGNCQRPQEVLQGNILRCLGEIGNTVKDITQLIIAIKEKGGIIKILEVIGEIAGKIQPLMQECSNPICLTDAEKRCQEQTGRSCEQYGAIMYPTCEDGFYNSGCCLCQSHCPPGFRDDGFFCAKPSAYGRGAGYPWKFGDSFSLNNARQRCESQNSQGCEQNGLIIYPKCASGYHNVGCCICSPDCPANTTDIGVSCTKPTYGRGVGYPIQYDDCQNNSKKTLQESSSIDYLSMNVEQLKLEIINLSESFIENRANQEIEVKIASELSRAMAAFEILNSHTSH